MKRIRASVLTGFIACGLLCLNLVGFAFSFPADAPVASYAAAPVDGDDAADAGLTDLAAVPAARRQAATIAIRQEPTDPALLVTRHFLPVSRHSSLTWHFVQRAAAAPRAPSFLA